MKIRLIVAVLCLALLAGAVVSCTEPEPNAPLPNDPVPEQPTDQDDPTPEPEIDAVIALDDLPTTRRTDRFRFLTFAGEEDHTALRLKLPIEWSCVRQGAAYELMEQERVIGRVAEGIADKTDMSLVGSKTFEGVLVKIYNGVATRDNLTEPYYQIEFSYADGQKGKTVSVEVKQSGMDATLIRWCHQPEALSIRSYNEIPSVPIGNGNNAENVILIGNSFLFENYSNIVIILRQLMKTAGREDCVPYRFSNGYATVTTLATEDGNYADMRRSISSGSFNAVFLCGLYSGEDVDNIAVIRQLCAESGTRLVLLPAHNESRALIEEAKETYPDIPCLDWKSEIDALIESGVKESEFVNDDAHGHSKPLAGYVGAHMLYRCLFGEIPPALLSGAAIDQSYVNAQLGSYVNEGILRVDEDEIRLFH